LDFLSAEQFPWLDAARERIHHSATLGRLPHSLLMLSVPGLGVEALARWTSAYALCESAGKRPCGTCPSCRLLHADSHPDALFVRIEEDAQQIKIDQVRALIEALTLKSYRGGYKVGVIEGAEALNANGANAFLKTLEEPTQNTMLILTARPTHRLPATIASRCLRLTLRVPPPEAARAWLAEQPRAAAGAGTPPPVAAVLGLAGGAPLLAAEIMAEGLAEALDADMRRSLQELAAREVDITWLAEQWMKSHTPLRIAWLENWITTRVRTGLGAAETLQTAEPVRLPAALLKHKIRKLFEWLDATRQFRRLAATGSFSSSPMRFSSMNTSSPSR